MASRDQFQDIWDGAKAKYKEVTDKDLDDPAEPHPSSTDDLLRILDERNTSFEHWRNKKSMLHTILRNSCLPIEVVGRFASGPASTAFPPAQTIFSAVTNLIDAARGVSKDLDAISGLMDTLKDFLSRLQVYNREDLPQEMRLRLAEILALYLQVLARATKVLKNGLLARFKSFGTNILQGSDSNLQSLVDQLHSTIDQETRLVGAETYDVTRRIDRKQEEGLSKMDGIAVAVNQQSSVVYDIRHELGTMSSAFRDHASTKKEDRLRQQDAHITKILQRSMKPVDRLSQISRSRVAGTGDWVRDEPLFSSWLNHGHPVLWLSGIPGSGKSYISGNVISYLQDHYPQGVNHPSRTSVAYYFFRDADPQTRDFVQALRDVAFLISKNDPIYAKYLETQLSSDKDVASIESAWRLLFYDFFIKDETIESSVFVVLDGIDEAYEEGRQTFIDILADLDSYCHGDTAHARFRLMMIGRPQMINDIDASLGQGVPTILVDQSKNGDDILQYAKTSLEKSKNLRRAPQELKEEIKHTLVEKANGMFIWVDLIMRQIASLSHASSIRESLRQAPRGLHEMLRHVLESFSSSCSDEDAADLNEILAWVTVAERPLSLSEIDAIIRLKRDDGDEILDLEGQLRTTYASFFVLSREDGLSTADLQTILTSDSVSTVDDQSGKDPDGEENASAFDSNPATTNVTFCHASIGDFFRDRAESKVSIGDDHPSVGVEYSAARFIAAQTCLEILVTTFDAPGTKRDEKGLGDQGSKTSLARAIKPYALKTWAQHLVDVLKGNDTLTVTSKQSLAELLLRLFRDPKALGSLYECPDFVNREAFDAILVFLGDADVTDWTAEAIQWKSRMIEDKLALPRYLFEFFGAKWLQEPNSNRRKGFAICVRLESVLDGKSEEGMKGDSTEANIIRVAERIGGANIAAWNVAVGSTLVLNNCSDAALGYYGEALKLDPSRWKCRSGIVLIKFLRKDFHEALELALVNEKVVQAILEKDERNDDAEQVLATPKELTYIQTVIANIYAELGEKDNRDKYYWTVVKSPMLDLQYIWAVFQYINCLISDQAHAKLMELFEFLQTAKSDRDCDRLTAYLIRTFYYDAWSVAAINAGKLQWLQNAFTTAIARARVERNHPAALGLEMALAELYGKQKDEEGRAKAMSLWDMALHHITLSRETTNWLMQRNRKTLYSRYGEICFQRLMKEGPNSPSTTALLKRLEKMSMKPSARASVHAPDTILANRAALALGKWHHHTGQDDLARSYIQPYMKLCADILSDDDPDNDLHGLYELAHVLCLWGDDRRALAVARFLRMFSYRSDAKGQEKTLGDEEKTPSEPVTAQASVNDDQRQASKEDGGSNMTKESNTLSTTASVGSAVISYFMTPGNDTAKTKMMKGLRDRPAEERSEDDLFCDGVCGNIFRRKDTVNICRYCWSDLCDECLGILKRDGDGKFNNCSPSHDWLAVPALTKAQRDKLGENNMLLDDDEVVPFEAFIKDLRKEWGIYALK